MKSLLKIFLVPFFMATLFTHSANAEYVNPFDVDTENNPNDITRLTCEKFVGISKGKYEGDARMLMFPILAWVHGWSVGISGEARPFNKEFLLGMAALLGAKCESNPQMTVYEALKNIIKKPN
jgi:hypothetical protein